MISAELTCGMVSLTSKQWRSQNLFGVVREWKASGRLLKDFSAACDLSPAYLSQLLSGARQIGDSVARKIESGVGWPKGAMDGFIAKYAPPGSEPKFGLQAALHEMSKQEPQAPDKSHTAIHSRERLSSAIRVVRRALAITGTETSDDGFVELVFSVYDVLDSGAAQESAERIVSGLLRAMAKERGVTGRD